MKKLKSTLLNMFLSLTIISGVAAGALAYINSITEGPIAESKLNALLEGIGVVSPDHDNNPYKDGITLNLDGGTVTIYPARLGEELQGVAVESFTNAGFDGLIRVIVGLDSDSNVIDYTVLEHSETPGLGDKMQEWFREEGTTHDIRGMSVASPLTVDEVDAITAATITSEAFLDAINRAQRAVVQAMDEGLLK